MTIEAATGVLHGLIEPLHDELGARVRDVDLTSDLTPEVIGAIAAAMDEYSLLIFAGQSLTDEAQLAFTRGLGEPEPNHVVLGETGQVEYFGRIGNVVDEHAKRGNDDPRVRFQRGNNLWHSDSSFRLIPAKFSINHAVEVPDEGGETEFVSARAAYGRLSGEEQRALEPLHVLHDYVFSRSQVAPVDPNHAASLPPIEQKLVRVNPNNHRKAYYVGSHARSIVGWPGIESRRLIDDLIARATGPAHIYSHRWQAGDTVIWDNRCILHRGAGYDADRYRRLLRQTRVAGAGPTLAE